MCHRSLHRCQPGCHTMNTCQPFGPLPLTADLSWGGRLLAVVWLRPCLRDTPSHTRNKPEATRFLLKPIHAQLEDYQNRFHSSLCKACEVPCCYMFRTRGPVCGRPSPASHLGTHSTTPFQYPYLKTRQYRPLSAPHRSSSPWRQP